MFLATDLWERKSRQSLLVAVLLSLLGDVPEPPAHPPDSPTQPRSLSLLIRTRLARRTPWRSVRIPTVAVPPRLVVALAFVFTAVGR